MSFATLDAEIRDRCLSSCGAWTTRRSEDVAV
jgi:hypothetical protein